MTAGVRIVRAGDATLIVELPDRLDPAVNAAAIAIAGCIRAAAVPGVRDVVPTYRTVAIAFDPLKTGYERLRAVIGECAAGSPVAEQGAAEPMIVPVCYGGPFGPDLEAVAAFAGVDEDEVVRLHTSRTYRVYMLGFVPGFTYMGTVDDRIAAPRLERPRLGVPAGSVGIAGRQTGIYPSETPGGWRLIGRTPLKPFDPGRPDPFLFAPGDAVRFHAIDGSEYVRLARGWP